MSDIPDTTEVVAMSISFTGVRDDCRTEEWRLAQARNAIATDRRLLAEKGWTVAPVVKIKVSDYAATWTDTRMTLTLEQARWMLEHLQELGLPIEIES